VVGEVQPGDARRHARRLRLWIALAGQAGSTADEDFPGLAGLVRPDGGVMARLPDWREGVLIVDIPLAAAAGSAGDDSAPSAGRAVGGGGGRG
jgi:predicted amidohydrolase